MSDLIKEIEFQSGTEWKKSPSKLLNEAMTYSGIAGLLLIALIFIELWFPIKLILFIFACALFMAGGNKFASLRESINPKQTTQLPTDLGIFLMMFGYGYYIFFSMNKVGAVIGGIGIALHIAGTFSLIFRMMK